MLKELFKFFGTPSFEKDDIIVIFMGDVAIRFRVMPEGADADMAKIKAELKHLGARDIQERPVAFGIKFLDVLFVMPDEEGQSVEEKIRAIEGVGSVETESITLL